MTHPFGRVGLIKTLVAFSVIVGASGIGNATGSGAPSMSPPVQVVPSSGLPAEVRDNRSNNNVHTVLHGGRIFMVFRTAHWHLAASDARLYVVSSTDQRRWRFEGEFSYQRDLREARLLSWNGRLLLYFALLGANPVAFEPGGTMATEYLGPGHWTTPRRILFDCATSSSHAACVVAI